MKKIAWTVRRLAPNKFSFKHGESLGNLVSLVYIEYVLMIDKITWEAPKCKKIVNSVRK